MKYLLNIVQATALRRSREGAWIEIFAHLGEQAIQNVAPARERGLKSCGQCLGCRLDSRSREGAWIEIS